MSKSKPRTHVDSIDNSDSMLSMEDPDYNQLLPAVKVKKPRKKRSPSSNSNRNNSIGRETHNRSKMSVSGLKDPKLRDTLD